MKTSSRINTLYCCPHCLAVQAKSPGIQMLAEGADEVVRGAYHLDIIERTEERRCPRCQGILDTKRLIAGDYDYSAWIVDGPAFTGLALMAVLHWVMELGWSVSISISIAFTLVLWSVLSRWQKRRIRARLLNP